MTASTNPVNPSILAPLDGVSGAIPRTELCKEVSLRNLEPTELSRLNQILSADQKVGFGLGELLPEIVCLEAALPSPEPAESQDVWDHYQNYVRETGGGLIHQAITLLRLTQAGPIGSRMAIVPLAETIPSAYTLLQIGYIPPIRRPKYPPSYPINSDTLAQIRVLFEEYWNKALDSVPGIRWLNKAYCELNNDDRLAHLVFGLEQLLLREESERSYLSFKMALRGAWLLEPPTQLRVQRFRQLQEGYNLRSSVAHGSLMRALNDEELELTTELEEALRKLIRIYLKTPGRFQAAALNRLSLGIPEPFTENPEA